MEKLNSLFNKGLVAGLITGEESHKHRHEEARTTNNIKGQQNENGISYLLFSLKLKIIKPSHFNSFNSKNKNRRKQSLTTINVSKYICLCLWKSV